MDNQLLESLFAYKKTAALIAAFKLGLFRKIKEFGPLDAEIFHQVGWNPKYVELLCIFLEKEGYLSRSEEGWKLSKEFEKNITMFEVICGHESYLYYKWLTPENICLSVKAEIGDRMYDKEGFSQEEQAAYDNVLYGKNLDFLGFYLQRKIKRRVTLPVRCLEYGRSNGRVGLVLKRYLPEITVDIILIDEPIQTEETYDLVLVYNTIHYKTKEEWGVICKDLRKELKPGGMICIIDFFYMKDDVFQSTLLLDWLTHGGIYNLHRNQVIEQLEYLDFESIEYQELDVISTELIFAYT